MLLVKEASLNDTHDMDEPEGVIPLEDEVFPPTNEDAGGEQTSAAQQAVPSTSSFSPMSQSIISMAGAAFDGMVNIRSLSPFVQFH